MDHKRITYLYQSYRYGLATKEEIRAFNLILADPKSQLILLALLDKEWNEIKTEEFSSIQIPAYEQILENIKKQKPKAKLKTRYKWIAGLSAAAAIIILTLYIFIPTRESINMNPQTLSYLKPGTQGATLTLGDGRSIKLSTYKNETIENRIGLKIIKNANGTITYQLDKTTNTANELNTLSTGRGETYQINLPDGSQVWLNAASSLTYNTRLQNEKGNRSVALQGEAYFEISKDPKHPFIVETDKQKIEVLGTHFNISAYSEENNTRTTLLEGKVKINNTLILKPDEQAVTHQGKSTIIQKVDAKDAIAWKNNLFSFQEQDIKSIMGMISRWYDVEVVFEKEIPEDKFLGSISRQDNIAGVLQLLEQTGRVKFRLEGRRIYVGK